jgi:hypothetical protein
MSSEESPSPTFAILDRQLGLAELPSSTGEEYPLPAWYRSVQNVPLDKLSIEDICKACRERIHLEHVVPIAIQKLTADPIAGEMYDGELLVSLSLAEIGDEFWKRNPAQSKLVENAIYAALPDVDADSQNDIARLADKMGAN